MLLLGERTEELDLLLVGRLPLIVRFECGAQVAFNVYVKCLWLHLRVWRIVDSGNGSSRAQVMQVTGKFCEFVTSCLLLALLLFKSQVSLVVLELAPDIFVLKGFWADSKFTFEATCFR